MSNHSGFETTYRHSLNFCFVTNGLSLFEEIGKACILCAKLRARFIQSTMGPRDPSSYTIAPAFWVVQADLFGPLTTYVPGREANTRSNPALASKTWGMVFICMLSKAINIQVVEGHTAVLLAQGLSRLGCEVGLPARLLIDQDSSFMKVLKMGEVSIIDLETQMRARVTMEFQVCPVQGHNQHGLVESRIRVVQDTMEKMDLGNQRLHATGLQTWFKLIESDLNSCPFGVTMGRSESNSPLLKLICPDQLRMGRISNRIPTGPFKLPDSPRDLISRVDDLYWSWHSIFNDSMLPALLSQSQPKWFT